MFLTNGNIFSPNLIFHKRNPIKDTQKIKKEYLYKNPNSKTIRN